MNRGPVLCRFYAQGYCRYGQNCRFSHSAAPTGMGTGYQSPQQSPRTYSNNPIIGASQFNAPPGTSERDKELMESMYIVLASMQKDMQLWETDNIWRFSCYGPSGHSPSIPGFEDISEEEIRYESLLNGGALPPNLRLPERLEQINMLRNKYSQANQENREMILELLWHKRQEVDSSTQLGSIFGGISPQMNSPVPAASPQSIFGGGTSIFGGSSPNQTMGNNSSPFQGSSPSIFSGGGGTVGQQATSLSTFSFSPPAQTQDQFGMNNMQQAQQVQSVNNSSFSFSLPQTQQVPSGSTFAQFPSSFGQSQQSVAFPSTGVQPTAPAPSFPSTNMMGTGQQPFGTSSVPSFQPQSAVQFGQQPKTNQAQQDLFDFDSVNYSKMEDLSPEEMRAFEAPTFDDFFPMKLPPKHLCRP